MIASTPVHKTDPLQEPMHLQFSFGEQGRATSAAASAPKRRPTQSGTLGSCAAARSQAGIKLVRASMLSPRIVTYKSRRASAA
eukprot:5703148-Pyramimonas_sp.AAC.1